MGSARTAIGSNARFVTFKRRLVRDAQAEVDGVGSASSCPRIASGSSRGFALARGLIGADYRCPSHSCGPTSPQ